MAVFLRWFGGQVGQTDPVFDLIVRHRERRAIRPPPRVGGHLSGAIP